MVETVWVQIQGLLGTGRDVADVGAGQMAVRTIVIYAFTLFIVRLGSRRFLSEATAFDIIVAILLGSIMSRAINGSAPFFPTLLGGLALVGTHALFAFLAFHLDWFGPFVKGSPVLLVKDGKIQQRGIQQTSVSVHDIQEAMRLLGEQPDISKVRLAYLERNGSISVIPARDEPRVVEVSVEDGVKTIRIERN